MDDFKIIARLLGAIRAGEEDGVFNVNLVDEKVLKTTAKKRDSLAIKLQKKNYIDGLLTTEDIDNMPEPCVLWAYSHPTITLDGLEYIATNAPLQKAMREIKEAGISLAAQIVSDAISSMIK